MWACGASSASSDTPSRVIGLATARALLERLEEALAAQTAAMVLCGIARTNRAWLDAIQDASQLVEEPSPDRLQDVALFSGADATLHSAGFTPCLLRPSSITCAISRCRADQVQGAKVGTEGSTGLAKASRR